MVVTPDHRPIDATTPLSPLLLASASPSLHTTSSSASLTGKVAHPIAPVLRKHSTGSFSKLSEFQLDGPAIASSGASQEDIHSSLGLPHVNLSIDAR